MSELSDHEKWVALAEEDWLVIQNSLAASRQPWQILGFHAQQAAEKYLKPFLVFKGARPDFTHDLGILLTSCRGYDPSLEVLREDCEMLTDFAVDARYEYDDRPSEMDAREAIEAAQRVTDAVKVAFNMLLIYITWNMRQSARFAVDDSDRIPNVILERIN